MATFVRVNISEELKKAALGRKTKIPVASVLIAATEDDRVLQAAIMRAFGYSDDRPPFVPTKAARWNMVKKRRKTAA